MGKVIFWEQLNGRIVAQRGNDFFEFPQAATKLAKNDTEFRRDVAINFDGAPFKTACFNLPGATVIDEIEV